MIIDIEPIKAALAGSYEIERELGAGGMAVVFLARDVKHRRHVAVKVLRPELAASIGPKRFLDEIEIAAGLQHPHILPVFDSGESAGVLYYVMPYVDGDSLRARLTRHGELPIADAVVVLREVVDALAYAHARGVVHRDIKPDNVLFYGNHAAVADFGLARAVSEASISDNRTTAGLAVGTPTYMAPEQASGASAVDQRADIYALGIMAYEMLTGRPPFSADTPQRILTSHLTETPRPVTERRPTVPGPLASLVMRCLAKRPADRFQDADELLLHLGAVPVSGAGMTPSPGITPGLGIPPVPGTDVLERSIVVLPFVNVSRDPENEYFSDGITEEIINALSRVRALRVVSRTSSFAFKDKNVDVRTIGEKLNVGTVLEGSVQKFGNRFRVSAQLVKAGDGFQLWSDRYDHEMEDLFAMQDEISQAIVSTLTETLTGATTPSQPGTAVEPLVKPATENIDAYNLYLKGRYYWNKRTVAAMQQAVEQFRSALELDAEYAPAHAGLADCYSLLGWVAFGALEPKVAFPKAINAAVKALEVDESLAEAHNSLGWSRLVFDWDWTSAEKHFTRAIELNPRFAMGHSWYGLHLCFMGRTEEALAESARAQELDPLALIIHTLAGWVHYFARDYDASVEQYNRTLDLDPNYVRARLGLGWAYEQMARHDEAIAQFEKGVELSHGNPRYIAALGHAQAVAGDHHEARAAVDKLVARSSETYVSPAYIANVHMGLGDAAATCEWLQKAFDERSGALVYMHVDPQLDGLRDDPGLRRLQERMEFPR